MEDFNFGSIAGHSFSLVAIAGTLAGWFPAVAVLLAIIWYTIQIYESKTTQRWLQSRRLRKLATLKIEMARLEALELLQHPKNPQPSEAARQLLETARGEAEQVIKDAAT